MPPGGVFGHKVVYLITSGLYVVPGSSNFVAQSSNFVPITANRMTEKFPMIFHMTDLIGTTLVPGTSILAMPSSNARFIRSCKMLGKQQ